MWQCVCKPQAQLGASKPSPVSCLLFPRLLEQIHLTLSLSQPYSQTGGRSASEGSMARFDRSLLDF